MGFLDEWFEGIVHQAGEAWQQLYVKLGEKVFFIEKLAEEVMSSEDISKLFGFISAFTISLLILKVLKKGFMIYVLWRDGDPDTPISSMIMNVVLAVALIASFPTLYEWYASVSLWLIARIVDILFGSISITDWVAVIGKLLLGFAFMWIFVLIYLIMLFVLYLQFLKRSLELLVMRVFFPLACLGLIDSDNGVFAPTVKIFLQLTLTTVIQLFFFRCLSVCF